MSLHSSEIPRFAQDDKANLCRPSLNALPSTLNAQRLALCALLQLPQIIGEHFPPDRPIMVGILPDVQPMVHALFMEDGR